MVQVKTDVYPGFATDLQQPITPLLLTAKSGEGVVIDNIYPKRIGHIAQLQKMGANIKVEDNIILAHVSSIAAAQSNALPGSGGSRLRQSSARARFFFVR